MSRHMTKPTKWHMHPAKTQIRLGIWSVSSLCTQWVAEGPSFLHTDSKDTDQTQGGCPGWSKSLLGGRHFVGFVMWWLILDQLIQVTIRDGHSKTFTKTQINLKTQISLHTCTVSSDYSLDHSMLVEDPRKASSCRRHRLTRLRKCKR